MTGHCSVNFKCHTMNVRLLAAAENGDTITVRKLLKKPPLVDVNCRDDNGTSALSWACKGGHFEIVQLLLEFGATVDIYDGILVTPLHLAASGNNSKVVKLLLLHGASENVKNKEGTRPIDLCAYDSQSWKILHNKAKGQLPEIVVRSDVPLIPDFAIANGTKEKKKKKKGKKGGKKKGKKKK